MSNETALRDRKKEFINNIAEPEFLTTLLSEGMGSNIDGYTHKDGTRVLLSTYQEYERDDDGAKVSITEYQGKVILIKGNDYLCFNQQFKIYDFSDYKLSELEVSIGKMGQGQRETRKFKGPEQISMNSSTENNIARILKENSPDLYAEYNRYVPKGINLSEVLYSLRSKQNIQRYKDEMKQSEAEKNASKLMFTKALNEWKNIK